MLKRNLTVDVDYTVRGDPETPHRLIRLRDPDQPQRVVTRLPDGTHVSIHPSHIRARWDDPSQMADRQRAADRKVKHAKAIDLADRLGFAVARDGDGWEAHTGAEARLRLGHYVYRAGGDSLTMDLELSLDAWLRVAPELDAALAVVRHLEQEDRDWAAARVIAAEQAEREQAKTNAALSREGRR